MLSIWVIMTMEWRKAFSYRVHFWINFLGDVLVQFGVAYFLWTAVYAYSENKLLGGFSYSAILLYSLCVPMIGKIVKGNEIGLISQEIYDGGLNRYLVYPISFFKFKYSQRLAESLLFLVQFGLMIVLYQVFWESPTDLLLSWQNSLRGLVVLGLAGVLFFFVNCIVELIAFWAEHIWSLMIMLRFVTNFLGGAMLPLSFFPEKWASILEWFPFYYLVGFPINTFLGRLSAGEWERGIVILLGWILVSGALAKVIWKKGVKQYTGIGI